MDDVLPPDIALGATLRGKEYGWSTSLFPDALARAESRGYACLGGQFQFRLNDGTTCEMYWLNADPSSERGSEESWVAYSSRSCAEVLRRFRDLIAATDFGKEAARWPGEIDPTRTLVFVAYFVRETDWANLSTRKI